MQETVCLRLIKKVDRKVKAIARLVFIYYQEPRKWGRVRVEGCTTSQPLKIIRYYPAKLGLTEKAEKKNVE
jgi:hypothetical protein